MDKLGPGKARAAHDGANEKNCPALSRAPGSRWGVNPHPGRRSRQRQWRFAAGFGQLAAGCCPNRRPTQAGRISPFRPDCAESSPNSSPQTFGPDTRAAQALGSCSLHVVAGFGGCMHPPLRTPCHPRSENGSPRVSDPSARCPVAFLTLGRDQSRSLDDGGCWGRLSDAPLFGA